MSARIPLYVYSSVGPLTVVALPVIWTVVATLGLEDARGHSSRQISSITRPFAGVKYYMHLI